MAWTIAMATHARAYAVDRALVVGEREFKEQCWAQLTEAKRLGTTFLVATDAPRPLREFCDRALVIIDGSIQAASSVDEGIELLREARAQGKTDEPPLG
jgi:ABC-type polysaccharide/polyol phosphate transport system ATPase subunit